MYSFLNHILVQRIRLALFIEQNALCQASSYALHHTNSILLPPYKVDVIIIHALQMRKLWPREVKLLCLGCTACKWISWDFSASHLTPEFTCTFCCLLMPWMIQIHPGGRGRSAFSCGVLRMGWMLKWYRNTLRKESRDKCWVGLNSRHSSLPLSSLPLLS